MSAGQSKTQGDGGGGKTTLSVMVAPNHRNHGSFSATTIVPTFDGAVIGKPKKEGCHEFRQSSEEYYVV